MDKKENRYYVTGLPLSGRYPITEEMYEDITLFHDTYGKLIKDSLTNTFKSERDSDLNKKDD